MWESGNHAFVLLGLLQPLIIMTGPNGEQAQSLYPQIQEVTLKKQQDTRDLTTKTH